MANSRSFPSSPLASQALSFGAGLVFFFGAAFLTTFVAGFLVEVIAFLAVETRFAFVVEVSVAKKRRVDSWMGVVEVGVGVEVLDVRPSLLRVMIDLLL